MFLKRECRGRTCWEFAAVKDDMVIDSNFAACVAAIRGWGTYPDQQQLVEGVVGEKPVSQFSGFRF